MSSADDRWLRVGSIYHRMLALPAENRREALAAACDGDSELANEVQSLLDQPDSAEGFLDRPAVAAAARLVSGKGNLLTGQKIGAFEIMDLLGVGGMGEVYRARDTKLGREVAVKVLPEAFAQDGERLARFNREARTLASLNHPNVAVIYGVEELPAANAAGPGSRALVMELVEGEDLSSLIARGPMPATVALPIARQIAKALEGAHGQGIVHRDLKPANIKVRPDGAVKVLDFGLAKVLPLPTGEAWPGRVDSQAGAGAMGTPGYMSPEQIRGQKVDWRSDLFAFGVVLYEMLSGRRAFAKASGAETMSATLNDTLPDLHSVAPGTDPTLALAVARCLEKNPDDRFQSAKDLGFALETVSHPSGLRAAPYPLYGKWRVAAAVAALAGLGIVGAALRPDSPARPPATYRQVTSDGHSMSADLSPDGETLAYVSTAGDIRRLMIRDLAGGAPVELYRSPRGLVIPRWSHSGRSLAIRTGPTEVSVFSRFGGPPIRIGGLGSVSRISWTPDDSELILGSLRRKWFWTVNVQTREVRRIEMDAPFPEGPVTDVSPDGERLLVMVWNAPHGGVWSIRRDGSDPRQHVSEQLRPRDARWGADGRSFHYLLGGANVAEIRRARILPEGLDSSPLLVQGNLTVQDSGSVSLSISPNGKLAYPLVTFDRNIWRADIHPGSTSDAPIPLRVVTTGARNESPQFSPSGDRFVFSRQDGELGELVVASLEGGIEKILASHRGLVEEPVWSPDGAQVAYIVETEKGRVLHVVNTLTGADRSFHEVGAPTTPEWAPGARLLYRTRGGRLNVLDAATGVDGPLIFEDDGARHYSASYSNRGDRVAVQYVTREERSGIAIVSVPDRGVRTILEEPQARLYTVFGWSADDQFIYAADATRDRLVAVRVDGKEVRTLGALPDGWIAGDAREIGGRLRLVLSFVQDRSDIWVVDNFDPGGH